MAAAVNIDSCREVLGMDVGPSEAETHRTDFLCKLARRELHAIKLVSSDAHKGIKALMAKVMSVTWQRCCVYFIRSVFAHAGSCKRRVFSAFFASPGATELNCAQFRRFRSECLRGAGGEVRRDYALLRPVSRVGNPCGLSGRLDRPAIDREPFVDAIGAPWMEYERSGQDPAETRPYPSGCGRCCRRMCMVVVRCSKHRRWQSKRPTT